MKAAVPHEHPASAANRERSEWSVRLHALVMLIFLIFIAHFYSLKPSNCLI
jgi:uncharacterized integral membrane protein